MHNLILNDFSVTGVKVVNLAQVEVENRPDRKYPLYRHRFHITPSYNPKILSTGVYLKKAGETSRVHQDEPRVKQ